MLEMDWTVRYFQYYARKWRELRNTDRTEGHVCYAARTEAMWTNFAARAQRCFDKALENDFLVEATPLVPLLDETVYVE